MEFAKEEDYDELESSSYNGNIEAFFKAQAHSQTIKDGTTDRFRDGWGFDTQDIFATEDNDDADEDDKEWSESALIQEQLRKIKDRGDRLRADREARLLQRQQLHPPPSGNHDQHSKTRIVSPEETHHIFEFSPSFTEDMIPRLILLLLLYAILTKKLHKLCKSIYQTFPKFMAWINSSYYYYYHTPTILDSLTSSIIAKIKNGRAGALHSLSFYLLYNNNNNNIFSLPLSLLPILQRHCFSAGKKILIGYILFLLSAPFFHIAWASYRTRVVPWGDLDALKVPYYMQVERSVVGSNCW